MEMEAGHSPRLEDHKAAVDACFAQLSRTLEAQVDLARVFLKLHSAPSREAAEGAVERLSSAVRGFDCDLLGLAAKEREEQEEKEREEGGSCDYEFAGQHWLSEQSVRPPAMTGPTFEASSKPEVEEDMEVASEAPASIGAAEEAPAASKTVKGKAAGRTSNTSGIRSSGVSLLRSSMAQSTVSGRHSLPTISSVKDLDEDSESDVQSLDQHADEQGPNMTRSKTMAPTFWNTAFPNGVISPQWGGRLVWDLLVILLVLMDAIVLPFQMAYKNSDVPDDFDNTWLWLTTALFAIDMVLSFLTAYEAGKKDSGVTPGTVITDKVRIAKNYLKGWFIIDLMSTVPWPQLAEAITGGSGQKGSTQVAKLTKVVKFVRFLRLMRMLRLAKLASIWERVEVHLGSLLLLQAVALVRVIFVIIAICHWNACIFWMVGLPRSIFTEMMSDEAQIAYEAQPHWTTILRKHSPLEVEEWTWLDKSTAEAYVFCFYWTLGVMRTMPAEVTPVNLQERIFVLVFMFFAFSAFAITVAQITQAFFKFSERRRAFNEELAAVRMYMRSVGASAPLQMKVKAYLNHIFRRRKIQAKEKVLLETLPIALKRRLAFAQKMFYLKKLEVFSLAPEKVHPAISELAEVCDVLPGDVLCRNGLPAQAVWVVIAGRLQVLDQDLGSSASDEGASTTQRRSWLQRHATTQVDVVDQECLLSSDIHYSTHTVVVAESSEVLKIDRDKFQTFIASNNATWLPEYGSRRDSRRGSGGSEGSAASYGEVLPGNKSSQDQLQVLHHATNRAVTTSAAATVLSS